MQYSTVLIIPAALLTEANALGNALGYGPESYTVPLSSDGETVTHYGGHTYATDAFFALIDGALGGTLPPEVTDAGFSIEDVAALLSVLIVSAPGSAMDPEGETYSDPAAHFNAVIEANGLQPGNHTKDTLW
mgnify:FL=1